MGPLALAVFNGAPQSRQKRASGALGALQLEQVKAILFLSGRSSASSRYRAAGAFAHDNCAGNEIVQRSAFTV